MKYYTADYILPITSDPIKNGVVATNEAGKIEKLGTKSDFGDIDVISYEGVIIPGLINTHCHLELSHMKGICQTGTTLIPFIQDVVKQREVDQDIIKEHIAAYDQKMWEVGIQAVGDISNKVDTAEQKDNSPITYYTFVEMFDFMHAPMTRQVIENYRAVFRDQSDKGHNKKSLVPHAPYSVSPQLFDFINKANPESRTISIHNQETLDENLLFLDGSGEFKEFFGAFGVTLEDYEPSGKTSIHYTLENLSPQDKNIFVHNTLSTEEDIKAAHNWSENIYWATCPNANLYIENKLPYYKNFINQKAKMTIGTDSIMSNWQLCVWSEIKTISQYQSYVPLTELLQWATINGAEALGYQDIFGSLEVGKSPGLVHINVKWEGENTDLRHSQAKRIC